MKFDPLQLAVLTAFAENAMPSDVETALASQRGLPSDFAALISPSANAPHYLEAMAQRAHELTVQHFGRVIRFFAPLYLSNECVNDCQYCGFSKKNRIQRVTLTEEEILEEARYLRREGFRHLLLVSGEHPHFISGDYLQECVRRLRPDWPSIALEVGPMETEEYRLIVKEGAEGLVIYQETYDRQVYALMHPSGPKRDFDWRLDTPERAYRAGFKRLGIGALLGLAPWRAEAIALFLHAKYLQRTCWKSQLTVSVPRLRPTHAGFRPWTHICERDLTQLVCAIRLTFPEIGIVLSTRESAKFRDGLIPLGVTMISAGSHTEPGGYTQKIKISSEGEHATKQFDIADRRLASEIACNVRVMGYEPVWKDWDSTLNER